MTEGDRPSTANSRHDYTQRCWLAQKIFRVHSRTRARACCSTAVPTTVLRSSEMTFGLATPNFHRSFTRFLPLFEEPAPLYSTNFPLKFNRVIPHTRANILETDFVQLNTGNYILSSFFSSEPRRSILRGYVYQCTFHCTFFHGVLALRASREKPTRPRQAAAAAAAFPLSTQATMNACTNASRLHLRVAFPPSSYVAARWYARVT